MKDTAIKKMKETFGEDQRRIDHALQVLKYSEDILAGEKIEQPMAETVILAAIFHDIGIQEAERKYGSNSGKYQEIEGPPIARRILKEMQVSPDRIDRICYIIGGHHTPSKVDGIDFQIIWEADLLVNIADEGWFSDRPKLEDIVRKNFKTVTGKRIAADKFSD